MKRLHITNGDCSVSSMQQAGITGDFLPWRDVLHDGPLPAGLELDDMSQVRANFIASCGWGDAERVLHDFRERDHCLQSFPDYDEVVLWFCFELYDQLQLLQLLAWFSAQELDKTALSIIHVADYLGTIAESTMVALLPTRVAVTEEQLQLGAQAWVALTAPDPQSWAQLLQQDTSCLPFFKAAVLRFLEEYPSKENGLARTERQILELVANDIHRPAQLFAASQKLEQPAFMGDWSFWQRLASLTNSAVPLLQLQQGGRFAHPPQTTGDAFRAQHLTLSDAGHKVLQQELDCCALNPPDKWLGGVHLQADMLWRWDGLRQQLIRSGP